MSEKFSLPEFFANKIMSRHNQFVAVRFVGIAGSGKSWAAISLAVEVAKVLGARMRRQPEHFFDFDEQHMSVMDADSVNTLMHNPVKNSILLLDDIGTVLNSRKPMSDTNIDFNNIFQTFRPQNNLVIMTMQSGFLVDKVARVLSHYEVEMQQNLFDLGLSIGKCQEITLDHKTGKIRYPYIQDSDGNRIVRVVFGRPTQEVTDRYEATRAEMLRALKEKQADKNEDTPVRGKKITMQQLLEKDILRVYDETPGESTRYIAKIVSKENEFGLNCNHQLVEKILTDNNLQWGKKKTTTEK